MVRVDRHGLLPYQNAGSEVRNGTPPTAITLSGYEQKNEYGLPRLWIASECVADVAGNRDSEHDPEGPSEVAAKGDSSQAHFIGELFGLSA